MDWHTLRGLQIVRVHTQGPADCTRRLADCTQGPARPRKTPRKYQSAPSHIIAHRCHTRTGCVVWHACVCVCTTHWSEVVHQGVQHPHCVVRGSLSSHSQAPRSKLELPPVINSAFSSPSLSFSPCSTLFQNSVTSASDCFIRFTKNKHSPISHCLFFFLGRSRILPCFSSRDTLNRIIL